MTFTTAPPLQDPQARVAGWLLRHRSVAEGAFGLAACLAIFMLLLPLDLAERFFEYSEQHEAWELDELFVLVSILVLGCMAYSLRQLFEIRTELAKRREAEARATAQALHDPLTGLANRRKLWDHLQAALAARRANGAACGLLMIDLDRFKPINDLHGHEVGDAVLKVVAQRLVEILRSGETVARLGGDEFAVVLPQVTTSLDAIRPARRILSALETPIAIGELSCQIAASIGIAVAEGAAASGGQDLMRQADAALYAAKRAGRNGIQFFEPAMDVEIQRRARLELALRKGLREGEFEPAFQPLVDLNSGETQGYEMLARWTSRSEGAVEPSVFIPIAEDTGLIGDLTLAILKQACAEARHWPASQTLAINISPLQLRDPAFPALLLASIREAGFDPNRLEVEVTETSVVVDYDAAKAAILALKAAGVRISLDDFGTGYSSLHHLRELPFDKLKIDRSFIRSMHASRESRKIVDAIVALGSSLGLTVLAEGVESAADAECLRGLGCDMGQGFHFGSPAPAGVAA
jgi:diguanylate cyclase (GGDEF)-like protein